MIVDANAALLGSMELIYEQSRPEVRGLWRERVDPLLRIRTEVHPVAGDWNSPWLELQVEPVGYLDSGDAVADTSVDVLGLGLLHDRPDERLAAMDHADVDVAVLHPLSFAGAAGAMTDIDLACGLLGGYNRYLGTYCQVDPRRLRGAIQLHGLHPEWSLLEIQRLEQRPWVAGATLRLPQQVPLWHAAVTPILTAVEKAGLPVFHRAEIYGAPGFPGCTDLWDEPQIAHVVAYAWDAQRLATGVVVTKLLENHPGLRICLLDGGIGWLPGWLEKLHHTDPQASERARHHLHEGRLVFATGAHESARTIEQVANQVGDQCLVWGSDNPRSGDFGPVNLTDGRAPAHLRERVLETNALNLLTRPPLRPTSEQES